MREANGGNLKVLSWVQLGLFNIINYLDECIERELVKFAYDTKVGAIANTLDDRLKIQNELNNLSSPSISSLPFLLSD